MNNEFLKHIREGKVKYIRGSTEKLTASGVIAKLHVDEDVEKEYKGGDGDEAIGRVIVDLGVVRLIPGTHALANFWQLRRGRAVHTVTPKVMPLPPSRDKRSEREHRACAIPKMPAQGRRFCKTF